MFYKETLKTIKKFFESEKKFIVTIFIISLAVRLIFIVFYDQHKFLRNEYFEVDTNAYNCMALSILAHQKLDIDKLNVHRLVGIGYPFFLSIAYSFFGENFVAVRIIQAFLGALTCIFLYWLGREVFNRKLGILTAIMLAFDPFHIYRTSSILTEIIFVFFLTVSLLFLQKGLFSRKMLIFILGNIFLALTGLFRAVAFGLYPFILFMIFILFLRDKKQLIKYVSCFLILLLLFVFLKMFLISSLYIEKPMEYSQNNLKQDNKPFEKILIFFGKHFMDTSSSLHLGINSPEYHSWRKEIYVSIEGLPPQEADRKIAYAFFTFFKNNPKPVLRIIFQRFINFWRIYPHVSETGKPITDFSSLKFKIISFISYGLVLPFFILGLVLLLKQWKKMLLFYALIFIVVFSHLITASQIRYRLQIVPAFIIFAGMGFLWCLNKAGRFTKSEEKL